MSHLFGAVVFAFLAVFLLRRGRGDTGRLVYLGVFALSGMLQLIMSTLYHMMVDGSAARAVMERIDHSAIFVLIAGTFTPAHGILFRGVARWGPLLLMWTAALAGITLKAIYFDGLSEWLGLAFYLGLGWMGFISAIVLWKRYGFAFIRPLMIGAAAYTIGALMEFNGWLVVIPKIIGPHEVFHVAVLIGLTCHWRFIWQFAAGDPGGRLREVHGVDANAIEPVVESPIMAAESSS